MNESTPTLEPGWHEGVPDETYHALPYVSRSRMAKIANGEWTWRMLKHEMDTYEAEVHDPRVRNATTDAKAFGSVMHALLLEPNEAEQRVIRRPTAGRAGTITKETENHLEGRPKLSYVVWPAVYDEAMRLRDFVMGHPIAGRFIEKTKTREVAAIWDEPTRAKIDGEFVEATVRCKAKIDLWVPGTAMGDLKFVHNGSWDAFRKASKQSRLDLQDAHYRRGAIRLGIPEKAFWFLYVDKRPPFDVGLYEWPDPALPELLCDVLYEQWATCEATGVWPGLPFKIRPVSPTEWDVASMERYIQEWNL